MKVDLVIINQRSKPFGLSSIFLMDGNDFSSSVKQKKPERFGYYLDFCMPCVVLRHVGVHQDVVDIDYHEYIYLFSNNGIYKGCKC